MNIENQFNREVRANMYVSVPELSLSPPPLQKNKPMLTCPLV